MKRLLAGSESHSWLRGDVRAEALQDNIRVGVSADFTLAYIDLLRSENAGRTGTRSRRIPRPRTDGTLATSGLTPASTVVLPLALLFSGDGSFECPFYLDPNDVLLRAVPGVAGLARFIHLVGIGLGRVLHIVFFCYCSPSTPCSSHVGLGRFCSRSQRPRSMHRKWCCYSDSGTLTRIGRGR